MADENKKMDPDLTVNVRNEEVEKQIRIYLEDKTAENLNALIEAVRTRRVLVPANLNADKEPVPCLIDSPSKGRYLPIYTSKGQIPEQPRSDVLINMPFLDANKVAALQGEKLDGIIFNPFTDNLIFKQQLVERIQQVEKARSEAPQGKTVQMTPQQYVLFERKQFEFGHLPKRFFQQGKQMLDELCEQKEAYVDQFFEECYQQKRMYPYLPEEFSVMVMNISRELLIVRVDLPARDMGNPSCWRVYMSWNEVTGSGRYFTVQRVGEGDVNELVEFVSDGNHIDYGQAPVEGAELQRIIDLVQEETQTS